jgi:hypothetical protein
LSLLRRRSHSGFPHSPDPGGHIQAYRNPIVSTTTI